MERMTNIKGSILVVFGTLGGIMTSFFGGWDSALQTLITFMAVDYATGLIVAGVFKKSSKTETGALNSLAGWKGLCKKSGVLLAILIATSLDNMAGTNVIRDAAIIGYIANEALSITENLTLMGVPLPKPIENAIEVLRGKGEEDESK
ncbi:MAG TPA: phage holin family protein [Oscillospiraceae bacterium]|nr:phage holin family protein [Oscillospiraceae bacterium]